MADTVKSVCDQFIGKVQSAGPIACGALIVFALIGAYKAALAFYDALVSLFKPDGFRNPQLLGWNMYGGNMPNWAMGSQATGGLFGTDATRPDAAVYDANVRGVGGVRTPQPAVYARASRAARENMLGADEVDNTSPVADSVQFSFDPTACAARQWGPEALVEAQGLAYMGGIQVPATGEKRLLAAASTAFNAGDHAESEEALEDVQYLAARGMAP